MHLFDSDFGFADENDDFCGIAFMPMSDAFVQLDPSRGLDQDAVGERVETKDIEITSPQFLEILSCGLSAQLRILPKGAHIFMSSCPRKQ